MSLASRIASAFRRKRPARMTPERPTQRIRATYDAARDGNEVVNIWANTDSLDADAANSLAVRTKLRNRDRYERGSNGHKCGIARTHANYIVGTGPKLKMQTGSAGFNSMVESAWKRWATATQFARKLRTLCRAKVGDGEAAAIITTAESVPDKVTLNLVPRECDRLTAPMYTPNTERYIDGIRYNADGLPVSYDILRRHPGSTFPTAGVREYDTYKADFVCHWYLHERSEQHRGIPECTSTLNLFPTARRFREATVAAAETAADLTCMIEMGMPQEGNDEVAPFTTLPIDKRTMTVMPGGSRAAQMRSEHPATTYGMFNRETLCEEARPLNMPYNIAACDSSGYSYSGGQLDHQTYFVSVEVEQQECEMDVVEPCFAAWFREAVWKYGWNQPTDSTPKHAWAWPGKPHNDPVKTSNSRKTSLSFGGTTLGRIYAEDGGDYEDAVEQMAAEYGVTIEEMKQTLFAVTFKGATTPGQPQGNEAQNAQQPTPPQSNGRNKRNGRNTTRASRGPPDIHGNGRFHDE